VETIWLQRLYVLFFIELGRRRVHIAGCTPNPNALWLTQQARQLTWTLGERRESFCFLIRDRDQKFTDSFDELFRSIGLGAGSVALLSGDRNRGETSPDGIFAAHRCVLCLSNTVGVRNPASALASKRP
jgi:hypothetical protein